MICDKCRADNPSEKKFCGDCGATLQAPAEPVPVPGDAGAFYCARHQKVATRVRCGRCEAPICTRCVVYGPVGARCRACAKHRVAVRPLGVLHSAGSTLERSTRGAGRVVWYMAIWYFVIGIVSNLFGGDRDV